MEQQLVRQKEYIPAQEADGTSALSALTDGVIGGLAGTAAMSVAMVAAKQAGLLAHYPPEEVTEKAIEKAGGPQGDKGLAQDALATLNHFAFGAAAGVVFTLLHRRLRLPIPPALHDAMFGSLVWAVSYRGWIPASGLITPEGHRSGNSATMLALHGIYGAVLGEVVDRREPEAVKR